MNDPGYFELQAEDPARAARFHAAVFVPGRCWQGYFLDTEGDTFGVFEVDPDAG